MTYNDKYYNMVRIKYDPNYLEQQLEDVYATIDIPTSISANFTADLELQRNIYSNVYTITGYENLITDANIQPVNTYYVDKAASGANNGSSWTDAYQTLDLAIDQITTTGVAGRLYIAKGWYYETDMFIGTPAENIEFIGDLTQGVGDAVYLTRDLNTGLTWNSVTNYYSAVHGQGVIAVYDKSQTDSFGDPVRLVAESSIANVNSTPGTWFDNAGTVYVQTSDSRVPDTDIVCSSYNAYFSFSTPGNTYYFKDLTLFGQSMLHRPSSSANRMYMYMEDCRWIGSIGTIWGTTGIIKNCTFSGTSSDILNYDVRNTHVNHMLEHTCTFYNGNVNSAGSTSDQFSTSHNASTVIRYNGSYGVVPTGMAQVDNIAGQCIADVSGSTSLNVNNQVIGSPSSAYFIGTGAASTMYIYGGTVISGGTTDIEASTSSTLKYYALPEGTTITDASATLIEEVLNLPIVFGNPL